MFLSCNLPPAVWQSKSCSLVQDTACKAAGRDFLWQFFNEDDFVQRFMFSLILYASNLYASNLGFVSLCKNLEFGFVAFKPK